MLAGLFLIFLPDWGINLRAQTSGAGLTPATIDFGQVAVGTTSSPQTVTLTNNDPQLPVAVNSITATGNFSASGCPLSLPPSSSCNISLTFSPGAIGLQTGLLTVVVDTCSDGCIESLTTRLTGNGVALLVALDDTATTTAGAPVTINVLANDTGTGLTVTQVSAPAHGSAAISGTAVTYTPAANFAGTDTFIYTLTDSFGQTDTATVTVTVNPPRPIAVDDTAITEAVTPVTINVLANDTGAGLTVAQVSAPANGTAMISGNTVIYTPNPTFVGGLDSFTYTIIDSFGQRAAATVTVDVIPPIINAVDDTATTAATTPVTINVLANDTGTGLTVTHVSTPAHGSAAISGTAVTYTPAANFAGTDTFTYTLTDGFGRTATATVTVTVNPPRPIAVDDTAITEAVTPVTINVLANDTGTGLTVTQVSTPAHGSAAISGATVSYTPAANFAGTDTFTYTLTDSFGQTATATVTVTVNPPGLNAVNDTASTAAGTPVTINVLANDTGTGLTVTQVSTPAHGSAAISGTAVTYTPAANFAGTDTFTYTLTDRFGRTATATVTVTVNPPGLNAVNDAATTPASTPVAINVLANDTGTGLTVTQVSAPANGSAVINANAVTYTPNAGFAGTDSFTYTVTDRFGQTAAATVTVTINPPGLNAVNDAATTPASMPVAINVLANDTGTGLTVTQVSTPAHGSAAISGTTVSYTPVANFAGTDTFTYTLTDNFGQTATATVTVTVNPPGLNAVNDTATTAASTPVTINVLANDTGTGLTVTQVSAPANGSAVINANAVTYTPNAGFAGTDSFTYTVTDRFGQTAAATVTVTINPPGLNAVNDAATTPASMPVAINVLANDTGTGLTVTQVSTPAHGSAAISGTTVSYTPVANFAGTDTFTYTLTDNFGQTATATVTVTVNPPGLNAVNDTASTAAGTPVTINVLANDTGTGVTVTQVSAPAHGSAAISGTTVSYTPAANFAGTDTFTYTLTDNFGQTATATVTVTVNPPGLNAVNDTASTAAGTPVTINVLANDTGTGLTVTQVSTPAHGSAAINGAAVTYTPAANFAGSDTFTYTLTDRFGRTATATVTVTVNPPRLTAVNDTASTAAGAPVAINVLANDIGTELTLVDVSAPSNGSAIIAGNGAVTYTPAANFAGTDAFTYTITDRFGQTATATVSVRVTPPKLDAVDDTATTPARTPITISVLANDVGEGLAIIQVGAPARGGATPNADGTIAYTPAANFAGTDAFTYTITDRFGQTATATVRVTVIAPALEALDDAVTTTTRAPVSIAVLANDIGTNLTVIQVSSPAHGSAAAGVDSAINYTPSPNFIGTDSFTYTITDGISTDSATVTVEVTRSKKEVQQLLEDATDDPAAKTVGRAIGGLCFDRSAGASFLRDCDALINAAESGDPKVGSALEQITPKSLSTAIDASQTSVQSQMLGIRTRMAALRAGVMGINIDQLNIQRGGWTLSGPDLRYLLASTGDEAGVPSVNEGFMESGPFGVFVSGAINLGGRDETTNQTGFDFRTLELTLGADYRFSDQFILGVALSYTSIDTDIDSNGGYLDTRGLGLTLYGVYYPSDRFYVEGMVNYGRNDYDQRRNVAYELQNADVKQGFDSSYEGRQVFADLGVGYQFTRGNLTFGPEAHLSYLDMQVDPFQEQVSGNNPGSGWAVAIDQQNLQSLVFSLGGRASYLFDQSWGTLEPQFEFSWLHEFKDNSRVVSGRFVEGAAVPDNIFQIFTDPVDKNYFRFGLGLQARFNQGPSILIQYRTLFDYEHLEMNTISTQLRWDF